jgi:hypothetical protein
LRVYIVDLKAKTYGYNNGKYLRNQNLLKKIIEIKTKFKMFIEIKNYLIQKEINSLEMPYLTYALRAHDNYLNKEIWH